MSDPATQELDERPEITRAPATAGVIGLVTGILSALLGVGGGLIMVPAMAYLLRIRQHRAVGTSLAVIIPTAIVAAMQYHHQATQRGAVGLEAWVIFWLAFGGVFGAMLGAKIASALNAKQLRSIFGAVVILSGVWMILRALQVGQPVAAGVPMPVVMDLGRALQMLGVGLLVGVVSALLGVGGGIVMVPALVLLLGYSQHLAQGTSLAVIIPVSISGALAHMARGNVIWSLVPPMAIGAMLSAAIMADRVFNIPDRELRIVFGVFMMAVGASMARVRQRARAAGSDRPQA